MQKSNWRREREIDSPFSMMLKWALLHLGYIKFHSMLSRSLSSSGNKGLCLQFMINSIHNKGVWSLIHDEGISSSIHDEGILDWQQT